MYKAHAEHGKSKAWNVAAGQSSPGTPPLLCWRTCFKSRLSGLGKMSPEMKVANVLTCPRAEAVASMLSLPCSMEGEGRSPARAASCRQDTKLVKLGSFHALRGARGLARASGDLMHVPTFTGTVILGLWLLSLIIAYILHLWPFCCSSY